MPRAWAAPGDRFSQASAAAEASSQAHGVLTTLVSAVRGNRGIQMSSGFYGPEGFGSSPFDDFLARIYGAGGGASRPQRVDITRPMSARARELLGAAAAKAAEERTWTPFICSGRRPRWIRPGSCSPGAARILTSSRRLSRRRSAEARARQSRPS